MLGPSPLVVLPYGERGAVGTSELVDVGANDTLRVALELSPAEPPPALIVALETSRDGVLWRPLAAWPRTDGAGNRLVAQPCQRFVRATWSLGAASTAVFGVSGEKLRPYALIADLKVLGVNGGALAGIPTEALERAIASASATVDSYLAHRSVRPIVAWGEDVREKTCMIAAWRALSATRGFNPESGSDGALRVNHDDALNWLRDVRDGLAHPSGLVDSATPNTDAGEPGEPWVEPVIDDHAFVFTRPSRGWT